MITLTEYNSTSPVRAPDVLLSTTELNGSYSFIRDPFQDNTSCVIKWPDSNQSYIEIDPFETCSTGCTPNETLYHSVLFIALFIIPFMALRNCN